MGEFDGRKVIAGVIAVFMSAGLIAVAGPFGVPFFLISILYMMIASTASNTQTSQATGDPIAIQVIENPSIECFVRSREIVWQNTMGEKLGIRQQEVLWKAANQTEGR